MHPILEERSLAEKLQPRLRMEEHFARIGGKLKAKSFFRRNEKRYVKPFIKLGLQCLGVYNLACKQALSPIVTELDLHFPELPESFDGFRLLHLSDLHIDGVDGLVEALIPRLRGIEADVCVLTGDYRFEDEGPCDEVYRRLRKLIPSLFGAAHRVFATLGNHDESCMAFELEKAGLQMLINESVEIERGRDSIFLTGLDDDFDYHAHDLPGALSAVPPSAFKILLAHTPDLYREASDANIHLYLCGHTHGGQIRIPKVGAVRSNARCPRSYTYRYWSYRGMHGYTSGGVGCSSLPVRLNCPPELVLITLRRA